MPFGDSGESALSAADKTDTRVGDDGVGACSTKGNLDAEGVGTMYVRSTSEDRDEEVLFGVGRHLFGGDGERGRVSVITADGNIGTPKGNEELIPSRASLN